MRQSVKLPPGGALQELIWHKNTQAELEEVFTSFLLK